MHDTTNLLFVVESWLRVSISVSAGAVLRGCRALDATRWISNRFTCNAVPDEAVFCEYVMQQGRHDSTISAGIPVRQDLLYMYCESVQGLCIQAEKPLLSTNSKIRLGVLGIKHPCPDSWHKSHVKLQLLRSSLRGQSDTLKRSVLTRYQSPLPSCTQVDSRWMIGVSSSRLFMLESICS